MKPSLIFKAILAALLLASAASALTVPKVIVALKPDKNPEHMLTEKTALELFLSFRFDRPVEVVIPLSAATILEGLANGSIDLGYLSATDMVNARTRGFGAILLAGEFPDGRTAYDSYWVVPTASSHQSIANLRGRPVAFASRTSTSGFVIPVGDLHQRGLIADDANLEAFFGRGHITYGTGYVSAIARVLAGEAEAAAVSYYVLDLDKHLSVEERTQLRRLQSQGPVPSHVVAVRTSLPAADIAELRAAFLTLNEPGKTELRDRLFTTKLVEVDEAAHLGPLADALALARRALR